MLLAELRAECEIQQKSIYLQNGTEVLAISSDYAGASGSNHGWVSYEEIWAVVSENGRRLFEELTSVPTRRNSIKFIATYSGFEGESELLMDLYKKAVGKDEHPDGQGERIHPTLPIYANREARIFCYWDHEPRMPWQTQEYYDSQRRMLRPATYQRLHQNMWTSGESRFIDPELWDQCVAPIREDPTGDLFVGIDASVSHDSTALVALKYAPDSDDLVLATYRIWQPSKDQPMDFEATIEFFLRRLQGSNARVERALCDPFQLHRTMGILQQAGIFVEPFPQTLPNLTLATESLLSRLSNRRLQVYAGAHNLRRHVLNASSTETSRGLRLSKEKQSLKIDGAVALSFAVVAAEKHGRPTSHDDAGRDDNRPYHQTWDSRFDWSYRN